MTEEEIVEESDLTDPNPQLVVFLNGSLQEGFRAVGPFWSVEEAEEVMVDEPGVLMPLYQETNNWSNDFVQFPRLLAEIKAAGLKREQVKDICTSMDINEAQLEELFERADIVWEEMKRGG